MQGWLLATFKNRECDMKLSPMTVSCGSSRGIEMTGCQYPTIKKAAEETHMKMTLKKSTEETHMETLQ